MTGVTGVIQKAPVKSLILGNTDTSKMSSTSSLKAERPDRRGTLRPIDDKDKDLQDLRTELSSKGAVGFLQFMDEDPVDLGPPPQSDHMKGAMGFMAFEVPLTAREETEKKKKQAVCDV